jgi:hypothetical protein
VVRTQRAWRTNPRDVTWVGTFAGAASTVVLFVGAYASMASVRDHDFPRAAPAESMAMVGLQLPVARPRASLEHRREQTVPRRGARAPDEQSSSAARISEASRDLAPADSSPGSRGVSALNVTVPQHDTVTVPTAVTRVLGPVATPIALHSLARELSAAARDSMLRMRMEALATLARDFRMTEAQKRELLAQREPGALPADGAMYSTGQRGASPVLSGGGSLAIMDLLFPRGPRRVRDSVIDADNRARLARLQVLVEQRRRLALAESLRVRGESNGGSRSDSIRLGRRQPRR